MGTFKNAACFRKLCIHWLGGVGFTSPGGPVCSVFSVCSVASMLLVRLMVGSIELRGFTYAFSGGRSVLKKNRCCAAILTWRCAVAPPSRDSALPFALIPGGVVRGNAALEKWWVPSKMQHALGSCVYIGSVGWALRFRRARGLSQKLIFKFFSFFKV